MRLAKGGDAQKLAEGVQGLIRAPGGTQLKRADGRKMPHCSKCNSIEILRRKKSISIGIKKAGRPCCLGQSGRM